jgi:acetylornithine deacetylase/succinyl-diaminopimelate desuccinylase-like protein
MAAGSGRVLADIHDGQHVRDARRDRPGTALPVYMGSHLDTQPTGGKYDGVLGVLGALEVVRTMNDLA